MNTRREFLQLLSLVAAGALVPRPTLAAEYSPKLGVAQWTFNSKFLSGEFSTALFPKYVHDNFGVNTIEWASTLLPNPNSTAQYKAIVDACRNYGMHSHALLVDGPALGVSGSARRNHAIDFYKPWIEAAHYLDCKYLRVNAWGSMGIQIGNLWSRVTTSAAKSVQHECATSISLLLDIIKGSELTLLVENHLDYSSNAMWLAELMQMIDDTRCRVMLDFGNWMYFGAGMLPSFQDPYEGCRILAPYTASVSAKSHGFDALGNETNVDYFKMIEILVSAGYEGYYVAEFETFSQDADPLDGIRKTLSLIEKATMEAHKAN
ncbi:MAG: TIM barrel protein [Halioglobus sp.]